MYDTSTMKEIAERNSNLYSELAINELDNIIRFRVILGSDLTETLELINDFLKQRVARGFTWLETSFYTSSYISFKNLEEQVKRIASYYQNLGYNVKIKPKWTTIPVKKEYDCICLEISWD